MKRMLNRLAGLVSFMSAGIFLSAVVCRAAGIYYNHTPSFPVGFYKIIDAPVGKGAYVSFCPPQAKIFDMAMARQTIDTGNCPGGYGMLLKDRKSTRLNSSHVKISYAVFCLKKKKIDKK